MTTGEKNTYSQILRSSTTIGSASFITILINIVRTKVVALLLGPSGIGLMSLLIVIMETMTTLAGLGMNTSGVRQVAQSHLMDDASQKLIRRSLLLANVLLGILGALVLWLARERISQFVFGDIRHGTQISWLGIGVFLSVVAGSQSAILQGHRRIGELARVSVISALLSAAAGIACIWFYGSPAIPAFIVFGPAFSFLVASFYLSKTSSPENTKIALKDLSPQWKAMLTLGLVFMVTTLMANLTQLAVRSLVTRESGIDATGHFQAAWSITMQYIGFVLAAMAADYYPRLTQAIDDKAMANNMVNEQIEVGLLIAAPVIIIMMALGPAVINLLYSSDFSESAAILRWQVIGDILKVAAWPMGFILLASAKRGLFFITQSTWHASYLILVFIGLPILGLRVTGMAFLACYFIGFCLNLVIARKVTGFRLGKYNLKILVALLLMTSIVFVLANIDEMLAASTGTVIGLLAGVYGLRRLVLYTKPESRIGNILYRYFQKRPG